MSDTAEITAVDPAGEPAAVALAATPSARAPGWWTRWRADPARMTALRDCWRALWVSRLVVLLAGIDAVVAFGVGRARSAYVPPGVTSGFGRLGDLLAAPVARWDAAWYLEIARYGYRPDIGPLAASRTAFFPLYPLGVRGISQLGVPPIAAGVALSVAAFAAALYGIHRLSTLEFGGSSPALTRNLAAARPVPAHVAPTHPATRPVPARAALTHPAAARSALVHGPFNPTDVPAPPSSPPPASGDAARLAVFVMAFAPMAFFFSAVYSESLYLALSVGVFWCARQGRWAWAGALGALASATRSAGVVLVVPLLILYLYGPREDRAPDFPARALFWRVGRPRYKLRRDVLWAAALPLGIVAYTSYLALAGGNALMPFHAQQVWNRHFAGPFVGVWDGALAAFEGARQLLSMQRAHVYFGLAGGSPFVDAGHNLMLFAFLLAAVPMVLGVLRRLPLAYGAYVLAALALPLSYPVAAEPLMSLPRFEVVLFPLALWAGVWLAARPRARLPALAVSTLLLVFFVGEFATWHWVA